jgi:hypothetical protein
MHQFLAWEYCRDYQLVSTQKQTKEKITKRKRQTHATKKAFTLIFDISVASSAEPVSAKILVLVFTLRVFMVE